MASTFFWAQALPFLAFAIGLLAIVVITHDAFEVMLLPRRVKSQLRIVRFFFKVTWAAWRATACRITSEDQKHSFLGVYGPLSLLSLLFLWASGLIVAFSLIYWSVTPNRFSSDQFLNQVYFSGATFFTLGYGDIVPLGRLSKALSVLEAGTGLGFIAMVIGYLPVLYQLFSRREAHVITLDAVAGSPPTAISLLCRHASGKSLDRLDHFFGEWQRWSAELLESQLSYPMLAYYRSQHDNQSWLAALASLMDAAVLVMVGFEGVPTFQARLTFATARLAIVEMGRALSVGPLTESADRLPPGTFVALQSQLAEADLTFSDDSTAEERLRAFRETYEPFLAGLSRHLMLFLPAWAPDPERVDNWVNTPRGKTAKRLVEAIQTDSETVT